MPVFRPDPTGFIGDQLLELIELDKLSKLGGVSNIEGYTQAILDVVDILQ